MAIVALPLALLGLDALAARWLLSDAPELKLYWAASSPSSRLTVYFTGIQASGIAHSAALRSVWLEHGDVLVVEYPLGRRDHDRLVTDTLNWLQTNPQYHEVTVIGNSMGVLLATMLRTQATLAGLDREFALILHDPTDGRGSIANPLSPAAELFYGGAITNRWLTGPFWAVVFRPPGPAGLGRGADPAIYRLDWAASGSYPFATWLQDVRFVRRHGAPPPGTLAGTPVVVIRSLQDTDVRDSTGAWLAAFGVGADRLVTVDAPHVSLTTHPEENAAAYREAYRLLANR